MKNLWRDVLATLAGAGVVFGAAGVGTAGEPPREEPAEGERNAERVADRLLERAQSASEAALAWLERRTGITADDVGEKAASAEEALRSAIDDAVDRAGRAREPGVRLLDAGPHAEEGAGAVVWRDLEVGPAALPRELVLLVHGMDEPGGIWDDLAPALAAAGFDVARFDYPNDQPLAESAGLLAESLADLRARGVERIDIVAHSAGGLITRDVLTRDEPGMYGAEGGGDEGLPEVGRVIMFGTPHHGAALARLRLLGEVREQFVRWIDSDGKDPAALLGFLADGDGEAADDLRPGSAYLAELNGRELPTEGGAKGVEFTVVVGTVAEERSRSLAAALEWPIVRRALTEEQIREAEAGILELGRTLGDGVVPVSSQVLEGVEDVVYVEANHRSMLRRMGVPGTGVGLGLDGSEPPAIEIVLERLKKK